MVTHDYKLLSFMNCTIIVVCGFRFYLDKKRPVKIFKRLAYSVFGKSLIIVLIHLNKVVQNNAFSIYDKNIAWKCITKTFNATGEHSKVSWILNILFYFC